MNTTKKPTREELILDRDTAKRTKISVEVSTRVSVHGLGPGQQPGTRSCTRFDLLEGEHHCWLWDSKAQEYAGKDLGYSSLEDALNAACHRELRNAENSFGCELERFFAEEG